jgi:tetratricopeptide (TPR) repeat protein
LTGDENTRVVSATLVALATFLVFLPVLGFPFLNWDDYDLFVRNEALHTRGVTTWAFTTRYMEHYQPFSWLTWAGVQRTIGLTPTAAHAINLLLHALCGGLVCLLTWRLANRPEVSVAVPSCVGALVWSLHPLRVETVAWASAMPYTLALTFALLATLAWLQRRSWSAALLLGLSLLSRPLALTLPAILWVVRRPATARQRWALLFAAGCVVAAAAAESSARLTASLTEFGPGARLTLAATAPWRYLWRTLWPVGLTPLDPLALNPRTEPFAIALGLGGIVLASAAAWRWRREMPVVAGAWPAYLLLLVPAMGLVPSGLQATADRYTYMPGVALSVALAAILSRATSRVGRVAGWLGQVGSTAVALVIVATLAALTSRQTAYWRDSTTLWTRAVEIDSRNDVALYNLGAALTDAGRRDEAIARYEEVLAIAPLHQAARRNRDLLKAARLEDEGNSLAARRDLAGAIERYREALKLDSRRTHAHGALGIALTELGRHQQARPHLQAALDQGAADPAIANALAYALVQSGEQQAAIAVLRKARERHPEDRDIVRNLEMLEKKERGR